MILPFLRGFLSWREAPLTWTLVALNIFFFLLTNGAPDELSSLDKKDIQWAGRYDLIMQNQEVPLDPTQLLLAGSRALRSPPFYERLARHQEAGDAVGFERFRARLLDFRSQLEKRPVEIFGLRSGSPHYFSWITYQFMHSGIWHLLGNLLLLLIFSASLEMITGGGLVVLIYLVGGLVGAFFFTWLNPMNSAPMVGASASLSAIMGFYALFERRKYVSFFFFLSPTPGYWGEVYLPTLLIIPFYFVEDLASYLATSEQIGAGIAYSAHLGGAVFGLILAFILRQVCRRSPRWEQTLYASYSRSRTEAP